MIRLASIAVAGLIATTIPSHALGLAEYAEWEDRRETSAYIHGIMSGLELYCGVSLRPKWEEVSLRNIDEALQKHAQSILPDLPAEGKAQNAVMVITAMLYPHDQMSHCINNGGGADKIFGRTTRPPGGPTLDQFRTDTIQLRRIERYTTLLEPASATCQEALDLDHGAMIYRFRQDYANRFYLASMFRDGSKPTEASEPLAKHWQLYLDEVCP